MVRVTRGEHGWGAPRDGVLSLLGEVGDPPDENAVEGGGSHLSESALDLSHGEVLQPHRPLQLTDLRHGEGTTTDHYRVLKGP